MVDRRSSCLICVGSTFDSWRMVIPKQMTMKPMTRVMICAGGADRPLKRTMVVMMEKNVTKRDVSIEWTAYKKENDIHMT